MVRLLCVRWKLSAKYYLLIAPRFKNPHEVWDAFALGWMTAAKKEINNGDDKQGGDENDARYHSN